MSSAANNIVVWEGLDWKSMECLQWRKNGESCFISSQISGVFNNEPFNIEYWIEVDMQWQVKRFIITDQLCANTKMEMHTDRNGKWYTADNTEITELEGCYDIDISLTPFTNTLPIRRLDLKKGEHIPIDVLYVKLPEFSFSKVRQYYTLLDKDRYLYEGVFRDFRAELAVDENKMVIDYPGLAKRLYPIEDKN
jgi:uncharacterized protein